MKKIYIIGAGGHAEVVADILIKRKKYFNENIEIVGFLSDDRNDKVFCNLKIVGELSKIEILKQIKENYFIIAIGNNNIRKNIAMKNEIQYYTAIHPSAIISEQVEIGEGTTVMAGSVINAGSVIGKHVIINTFSLIEHDNIIEDFVHVSPRVSLGGNVKIGTESWIGIGSVVIQGIEIGKSCIVGASSLVLKNISDNKKVYGHPCKEV